MSEIEDAQKQQLLLQAKQAQGKLSAPGQPSGGAPAQPALSVFGTPLPGQQAGAPKIEPQDSLESGFKDDPFIRLAQGIIESVAPYLTKPLPAAAAESIDNQVRATAAGATFNFADEMAAGAETALGKGTYEENVAAQRERDALIPAHTKLTGEVAGGIATGSMLGKAGVSLLAGAKPTIASLTGRGAAEGAAYGAAYGAGAGEGAEGKVEGALTGAALGAGTGGITGAFAGLFSRGGSAPATVESVRKEADKAFAKARKSGLEVTEQSFKRATGEISDAARKAGIDPTIHPKASAALSRLQSESGPKTLDDVAMMRRVLKSAAASNEPDERRIAAIMIDELDDYFARLGPADIIAGDRVKAVEALTQGRVLWSRYRKGEAIAEAIDRAGVRAGQFSGSGYENALRTEFRSISMNTKRMRTFTKAEQAVIRKVAMGGPIENAARMLGKFAPRGIISATLSGGVGYGLGGPVGSAAVMGAGELGRAGATAMTKANANAALERMLTGKGPVTLTREQADALRSFIVGGTAGQ